MEDQKEMWLKEIEEALNEHYAKRGYVKKEMEKASACIEAGKEYFFKAGLFGTQYDNRQARIFLRDGHYSLFYGWGKSSNKSFR